ncbi:IS3 family transposase [Moraxella caprae]
MLTYVFVFNNTRKLKGLSPVKYRNFVQSGLIKP